MRLAKKKNCVIVKAPVQEIMLLNIPTNEDIWPEITKVNQVIARLIWAKLKVKLPNEVNFEAVAIRVHIVKDEFNIEYYKTKPEDT